MTEKLDALDRAVLEVVQRDARLTSAQIGALVGASTTTVHRRLKSLRDNGVIRSEIAVLDSKKLNSTMTFIVSVEVERERIDLLERFEKDMLAFPEVQQCYYVTGDVDFVLVVKAQDMDSYAEFSRAAFFDDSNVRRFRTSVVMSEVKLGLRIPV